MSNIIVYDIHKSNNITKRKFKVNLLNMMLKKSYINRWYKCSVYVVNIKPIVNENTKLLDIPVWYCYRHWFSHTSFICHRTNNRV